MSNPLENKEFKHYLNFLNDEWGLVEISEPVKFDASEFFLGQDDGYARDLSFMNEEIDLEFYQGFYEPTDTPYQLPNGVISYKLSHGFEFLIDYNTRHGFQAQVEYVLERNGVQFTVGELNFEGAVTDELTYFKCKVVQATKRALAKRRADIKIDGFAAEDLDGNEITPLSTTNILLKAKPVIQNSKWVLPNEYELTLINWFVAFGEFPNAFNAFNYINSVQIYGINDTLSYFADNNVVLQPISPIANVHIEDFVYLRAEEDLTDMVITISNVQMEFELVGGLNDFTIKMYYYIGEEIDWDNKIEIFSYDTPESIDFSGYINTNIPRDNTLWIWFEGKNNSSILGGFQPFTFQGGEIFITTTATTINTVIKGVRYYDVLNQSLKAINSNEVVAPKFQSGGEFYDLFCFSGNLIRQRDDVPFYFTFKDRRENLMMLNADCQVNETDGFGLQYNDFYANVDNGGFLLAPSDKFFGQYNERYTNNSLEYGFKTYEKDRDEANTLDSVHTQTQWSINNTRVANVKKIQNNDILDPFVIEANRAQTYKTTTALDTDNKMHVMDCVPLAPNYLEGFTASMAHNINSDGYLQLLKDADLPSWALLGFGVGDTFTIDNTANADDYTVIEITDNIITLEAQNITPIVILSTITQVSYYLTNVAYTNRTNEGFDLIEGIENPNKFGNLRYTIRRNLVHWESFMRTCAMYITDDIKNTEFINNGELRTQYNGGTIYKENANIVLNEIQDPILTPRLYDNDIIVGFDDALTLFQKYQELATVGGFIRMQDNNGAIKKVYPQSLRYTWTTKVMNIIGEERYENEIVNIYRDGANIVINEVYYSEETLPEVFYEANGDYVVLFDENNVNLINFTRYDKFIVQEGTFDNTIDLVQAIIDL